MSNSALKIQLRWERREGVTEGKFDFLSCAQKPHHIILASLFRGQNAKVDSGQCLRYLLSYPSFAICFNTFSSKDSIVSNVTTIGHSHEDYEDSGRIRKIIPVPGRCGEGVLAELPRQNPVAKERAC